MENSKAGTKEKKVLLARATVLPGSLRPEAVEKTAGMNYQTNHHP